MQLPHVQSLQCGQLRGQLLIALGHVVQLGLGGEGKRRGWGVGMDLWICPTATKNSFKPTCICAMNSIFLARHFLAANRLRSRRSLGVRRVCVRGGRGSLGLGQNGAVHDAGSLRAATHTHTLGQWPNQCGARAQPGQCTSPA